MTAKLSSILVSAALRAVQEQRLDGSFPSGKNGPYDDSETPVRNTSHWLVTLSRLISGSFVEHLERSEVAQFSAAAESAIVYLRTEEARPSGFTYRHRQSNIKDECNGLVGQAWTIEALMEAARAFDRADLIDLAAEVFLLHPFDPQTALWQRVDPDGTVLGFDRTFNHQLWFAAAGGEVASGGNKKVAVRVTRFLDQLQTLMDVTDEGRIRHLLRPAFAPREYLGIIVDANRRELALNTMLDPIRPPQNRCDLVDKSIGYHSFNLYGLAMLHSKFPDHDIWQSEKINRAVEYGNSDTFCEKLEGNQYGYLYNVAGIELAFALSEFDVIDREEIRKWLIRQFTRTRELVEVNTKNADSVTLRARLYEATRLNDMLIKM